MKKYAFAILCFAALNIAHADVYVIDAGHAEIGFSVKHLMVSNAKGTFKTFSGTIELDADNALVKAECTIDVASIDTNNEKRDKHLLNEDFFNVEKHPSITFKSTEVKKTADGAYDVTGHLNVLDKDHEISFPVTVSGPIVDPWGNTRLGFESNTKLNRRDVGITHGKSATIGETVKVEINVEAVKQKK